MINQRVKSSHGCRSHVVAPKVNFADPVELRALLRALSDTLRDLHKYVPGARARTRVLSRRRERYTAGRWARKANFTTTRARRQIERDFLVVGFRTSICFHEVGVLESRPWIAVRIRRDRKTDSSSNIASYANARKTDPEKSVRKKKYISQAYVELHPFLKIVFLLPSSFSFAHTQMRAQPPTSARRLRRFSRRKKRARVRISYMYIYLTKKRVEKSPTHCERFGSAGPFRNFRSRRTHGLGHDDEISCRFRSNPRETRRVRSPQTRNESLPEQGRIVRRSPRLSPLSLGVHFS